MRPMHVFAPFCRLCALVLFAMALASPQPARAQAFVAKQIENLISTDTVTVKIDGLSGALSGSVRIDRVTVSDAVGVFLTANDLAMDWSPLALVRGNVSIERLSAGKITLDRLPQVPPSEGGGGGGFSLPSITADVGEISIAEFDLGEAVAGVAARLSANAHLTLAKEPARLDFSADVKRLDTPGTISAKLAFAPDSNELTVNVTASEPAGGLVARLLEIPGAPPVDLAISSAGPLSDFTADGALKIGGQDAATLSARVTDANEGRHIAGNLQILSDAVVPAAYTDLLAGGARLDADLTQRPNGAIDIKTGTLTSNALEITASGTFDRSGENDLSVKVAAKDGKALPLSFPAGDASADLEITSVDASLKGAFTAATLRASAALPDAAYGDYGATGLQASIAADGFNLDTLAGPFQVVAKAASATAPEGIQQRVLTGPIDIQLRGSLAENALSLGDAKVTTGVATASAAGTAAFDFSTFDLTLATHFETSALSPDAVKIAGHRLAVDGHAARESDGTITADRLVIQGEGLMIQGNASYQKDRVSAHVTGSLDQAAALTSALGGSARFELTADGPASAPTVDLTLNGEKLSVRDQRIENLSIEAHGTADLNAPSGRFALSGTLDGQPLTANADVATGQGGVIMLSNLSLRQGENSLAGDLRLTADKVPLGKLTIDFKDIAPLAALALQDASGDLAGKVDLAMDASQRPTADLALSSRRLAFAGNALSGVSLDVAATDYLKAPSLGGTVKAATVDAGGVSVRALSAELSPLEDGTAIQAEAQANGIPVSLAGKATFTAALTTLTLDRLDAAIKDAAVSLASPPATVTLAAGVTSLSGVALRVGDGQLFLDGSVDDELHLTATLDRVPAAIANPFVAGLDAAGTVTGKAVVSGPPSDPSVVLTIQADAIETSQTRAAHVQPLDAALTGTYGAGTLNIETATVDLGTGSIEAQGTAGKTLDLSLALRNVPASLANGFVEGIEASGSLSGTATATGDIGNPTADFDISGAGITARQVAEAGIAPLQLRLSGHYADGTARLETAVVNVGDGSLQATGTVGEALDLDVTLTNIPAGLANGFVPNLYATGTISGRAKATGSLANPKAEFELEGHGLSARQIAAAGIAPVELNVAGRYENQTATLSTAKMIVGDGSLEATGSIGPKLDLALSLDRIPVGLANGFVPGLDARGTISGSAKASGSLRAPNVEFDASGSGISTSQTRSAGAPPIDFTAAGRGENGAVVLTAGEARVGSGTVKVSGSAGRTLDINVAIADLPASLAAAAAPDIAPTGALSGTAHVTGTTSAPVADYDLRVAGLTVAQTRDAGVGPLDVAAKGQYADKAVSLDAIMSGSGIDFRANGSVRLAGTPELDLSLSGTVPLALANRILAEGGRSVQGVASVDARITGPATAPQVTGAITTSGASFVDTGANVSITGISTRIALSGRQAVIESFSAKMGRNGVITIGGSVGLDNGFPADLSMRVVNGDYNDGQLLAADFSADLTLQGPLTGAPLLAGKVNASRINVLVPEGMPTSLKRLDVDHKNASAAVVRQARELKIKRGGGTNSTGVQLDVTLTANNQVFVRGRGLDVELGGTLRLMGSISAPQIVGAFELQRGRFLILSRRLDFQRGTLTFTGGLLPALDLLATSDAGDATVNVLVTGPASDPSFNFSSTPALPQDEVLARLVFGQGTADLSPLQIAQLAEAAAELAGVGGSTGLLGKLRAQLGVDDLDIRTTEDGQTAVGVGKYINDRTYFSVDTTGRASVDLKLGAGVKARAAVGADGGGEVGLFYEHEY
ncbi:translocation/assembly module TamB domain-containing protein [Consotaella salsifontis]|uniref:Autotransporter secretion inner membrane protein TamB n=1 Tax=Consotaella salsifontis TaxID=1365950 RepID=A0A1T4PXI1_9HYPH|nr:translocation/assembly module TamB domain-containing protein [Consotaella salsifontis]SJZ96209.1 autotransporter secretion inner membrane protein TamB [Consotaella salsifontis]